MWILLFWQIDRDMRIKTKLTYGIGMLFAIIVLLVILSVKYIGDMSAATRNILADNYQSLDYARGMLRALNEVGTDEGALDVFADYLDRQQKNVTEVDEAEATARLRTHFERLKREMTDEAVRQVRADLDGIMSLNMASISYKSGLAGQTSRRVLWWIGIVGGLCGAAGLALLLLFPALITRPIKELTDGIVEISNRNYDKRLSFQGIQEFAEVALSFNNMAEKLAEFRRSTLADLLSSKKFIEAVVNSIHEPIVGLDGNRRILFVNEEALTVLNLKREEVVGSLAPELALRNDLLRRLVRELVSPDGHKEPLKIYADDKESYFQAEYIPIRVTDLGEKKAKYIGDVILLKNITEFKELDAAKTTFISTISHELKTPISAILMSLKLLEDERVGQLNEEQRSLADGVKENSERLLGITGELLKMTQVETGKLQLNPKVTKPIELIDYAVNATRVLAERFGCNVEVEYPSGKMPKLFVDSEKVAWVVTNLLSNAIHYSKENSRVVVGAVHKEGTVEIYVQDFGKGIDPRYHQSIFDRYFRVPGTKVQGSGLGLAISKDFMEAHGGTIRVESEVGKGSRFTVSFPVR